MGGPAGAAWRRAGLLPVYAFGFSWMFLVLMPVMVPFLLERGMTMGGVFSLQAVYGVAVTVLEIPTGYLCDVFGRKRTLLLGAALNAIGFTALASAHSLRGFFVAELYLGAGWSLVSGADIALIYDLLDVVQGDRAVRRRALADYQLAQVLGEASAALVGGALAAWSLSTAAWGAAVASWMPLVIAATLRAPPRAPRVPTGIAADLRAVLHQVALTRYRRLLFANMTVWGLSTFIAVWLLQPYWRLEGVELRWFGLLWGGTLLTVGIVGKTVPALERLVPPRYLMLLIAFAPVAAYVTMASAGGALGIAGGFLFYVSRGVNSVFLKEAFNHQIPAHLRATCNSVASGTFRLAFSLCGPVIGVLVDRAGLIATLWTLSAVFLAGAITLAIPLAGGWRRNKTHCNGHTS